MANNIADINSKCHLYPNLSTPCPTNDVKAAAVKYGTVKQ